MKFLQFFENIKNEWERKIQSDEWYFQKVREKLICSVDRSDYQEIIEDIVTNIISEQDDFLRSEYLQTLYSFCCKLETTKTPDCILEHEAVLSEIFSKNDYDFNVWTDLKNLFLN